MAGGPIFPHSVYPVDGGLVFPNFHVGAGANSKHDEGLGVANATDVAADVAWRLRFQMPPTLPTGTAKLRIRGLANATSGVVKPNVKWAAVDAEEDPSGASLNAEGVGTITWSTGDNDQYKDLLVTLDADTDELTGAKNAGGKEIVIDLVYEDASMTLAVVSTYIVSIHWE